MHGLAEGLASQPGYDLVRVHVGRGARPGLEHVNRELVVEPAASHFRRRRGDRLSLAGREHAEFSVDHGRGPLYPGERGDQVMTQPLAGDLEVLYRSLRLRAPERVGGYRDLAHRVMLGA